MKKLYLQVLLPLLLIFIKTLDAQTITTIAGTGTAGYNGDNVAATIAQLRSPASVTADNSGNVYIADFLNHRIRKINTNGFITTIAGTGAAGYNGDNILATGASLNGPEAPVFDQSGNLYFTDGYNNRIRRLSLGGTITTIAGTGSFGYNGDNIPANSAQVNYPSNGVLIDGAGNVIISDSYNHRIRKISTSGIISTIAGTGVAGYNGDNIAATSAQLNEPFGLAFDNAGNLYVAEGKNHRIRRISTTGIITTVVGTGVAGFSGDNAMATGARLNSPISLVIDVAGNFFIADTYNNRIRKVNTNGIISTIAGTGATNYNGDNIPANLATLNYPNGLALDIMGNLLIAELGNHRIRKINNVGIILPLSLVKFTAQLKNGTGLLQWQTKKELNTQSFVVEFSKEGVYFSPLGSVASNNSTNLNNYSFIDHKINQGINYYRLKMVDTDGKFIYSKIITLKVAASSLSPSPNPTSGLVNLSFNSSVTGKYIIQIADISGKVVMQVNGEAVIGLNKLNLDLRNYATGTYAVSILNADKIKVSTKLVKL